MEAYDIALADAYRKIKGLLSTKEIIGIRRKLGMSQQMLADFPGVSVRSVKRWEHGCIQDKAMDELIKLKSESEINKTNIFDSDWRNANIVLHSKSRIRNKMTTCKVSYGLKTKYQQSRSEESLYALPTSI